MEEHNNDSDMEEGELPSGVLNKIGSIKEDFKISHINKNSSIINFSFSFLMIGNYDKLNQSLNNQIYDLGLYAIVAASIDEKAEFVDEHFYVFKERLNKDFTITSLDGKSQATLSYIVRSISELINIWKSNFDYMNDFDYDKFFNEISSIEQPDMNAELKLDESWSKKIETYESFPLKNMGKMKPHNLIKPTFNSYIENFKKGKKNIKTMIHFPMIIAERGEPKPSREVSTELPESYIFKSAINCDVDGSMSYEMLESISYITNNKKKAGMKNYPDLIEVNGFTYSHLVSLVNRGVHGKDHEDLKDKKDKNLDWNVDLEDLDAYLNEQIRFKEMMIDEKDKYLIETSLRNDTKYIQDWYENLCNIEFYEPLRFFDAVMSEVIYNSKRNLKRSYQYIIRRIPGYKAYVIIKTTRLGSVHDPTHTFYSIVFEGEGYKSGLKLFEEVHDIGDGWKCTRFISTDRTRSSHMMNVWEQFCSIVWENLECLSTLNEKFNSDAIVCISKAIKFDLLLLINDSAEYSSCIHNLRYYYFPLMNGLKHCKNDAEQIVEKFPTIIRDPMLIYTLREMMKMHESLDEIYLINSSRQLTPKRIMDKIAMLIVESKEKEDDSDDNDDEASNEGIEIIENDFGIEDVESDQLPEIPTPFGFIIRNTRTFLKASYKQIYHNKDESNKGDSAKKIVSKIFKTESKMRKRLRENLPLYHENEKMDDSNDIYEFNLTAVIHGSDLLKQQLINDSGGRLKTLLINNDHFYKIWIERCVIMPTLIRTTYSELATTKSSFINNGLVNLKKFDKNEFNELDIGRTRKCIEAIHEYIKSVEVTGIRPIDNISYLFKTYYEKDGRIVVKIFKKNQNTGIRDIYILTIYGRMVIRIVEDISRSICKKIFSEKLTSPYTKDRFMAEHFHKVKAFCASKKINTRRHRAFTFKESGDMSEWANRWFMKSLSVTLLRLTPASFHGLIMRALNDVTNKHIELPRQFLISATKNKYTNLSNEASDRIKKEFLGQIESDNAEYLNKGDTRATCLANMMQGILHYTSSLAHASALALFRSFMIKSMKDKGFDIVMSYECSSDDKGVLMTVITDENGLDEKNVNRVSLQAIRSTWKSISDMVDSSFGIKTSIQKTNLTITSLFEFNSVFYCGNSISVPIAKFTSRCLDDSVQSSLHQRVCSLHSSLRQVRENGGSGILCSLLSFAQRSVLMNNIGWRNMEWFDNDVMDMICMYKFSHLGNRNVSTPITAGICMAEYEDMKEAQIESTWSALSHLDRNEYSDSELIERSTMHFGIWQIDKHRTLLKNLNLSQSNDMNADDFRIKMTGGSNKEELTRFIESTMSSNSFARSLAMCQRSDIARSAVYLLWSQVFKVEKEKISMFRMIKKLDELKPINSYMPAEYYKWMSLEGRKRTYVIRNYRSRLRMRQYDPLINFGVTRGEVVDIIKNDWYNVKTSTDEELEFVRNAVYSLGWIKHSEEETFKTITPRELHTMINTMATKASKIKLLARGSAKRGDTIESLMTENCCADMNMYLDRCDQTDFYSNDVGIIKTVSHRLTGWISLLQEMDNQGLCEYDCFEDMIRHSKLLKFSRHVATGRLENDYVSLALFGIKDMRIDLNDYFSTRGRRDTWIRTGHEKSDYANDEETILMKLWRNNKLFIKHRERKPICVSCKDIEVAKAYAEQKRIKDYSDDIPNLIIRPCCVYFANNGIVISDGYLSTPVISGEQESMTANYFDILCNRDIYLAGNCEKEFDIKSFMKDDVYENSICSNFGIFLGKNKQSRFISSLNEVTGTKYMTMENEEGPDFDIRGSEFAQFLDDIFAIEIERDDENFYESMQVADGDDILTMPEYTIAGTETVINRSKEGWTRNSTVRHYTSTILSITKLKTGKQMMSRDMKNVYYKMIEK